MYSFGIVGWSNTELQSLDRKNKNHDDRIQDKPSKISRRARLSKKQSGRGLLNLEISASKHITNLKNYFISKSSTSPLHKAIVNIDTKLSPLNLSNRSNVNEITPIDRVESWSQKSLHGRFANSLSNADKSSTNWLENGSLYAETEGFIFAIQDQVIATKSYQKFIEKLGIDNDKCRVCNRESETIHHITSGCSLLKYRILTQAQPLSKNCSPVPRPKT